MNYLDPITQRWEYEERVSWLKRLYEHEPASEQPSRLVRLVSRVLFAVGNWLVALGEKMQPHQDMPATAPHYKTDVR